MSLTLFLWLLAFVATLLLSIRRPAWGVALYMLTFFLSPPFWWWGKPIADLRWNLYAGLALLASAVISGAVYDPAFLQRRASKRFIWLAVLVVANATAVHLLLAPRLDISATSYTLLTKLSILFLLIMASIRDEVDLKIIVVAIVLGGAYIGYEVTINDRGSISGGRLEGVGVANASTANDLACLMVATVPLAAPLFLFGGRWKKLLALLAGPLMLNVIFLCNSRGAFLALIILGAVYLAASPLEIRSQAYKVLAMAALAGWVLLGDPRIVDRFLTTFSSAEERDASAASRLDFWKAGMMLVQDRPLGAGGEAFKTVYGSQYLQKVTGDSTARSVHQGYINVACEWGLQGLILQLMILGSGLLLAWRTSRAAIERSLWFLAGVSLSVVAGLSGLLFQSLFGTFLDAEWGLWMVALAVGCDRLTFEEPAEIEDEEEFLLSSSSWPWV